MQPRQMLRPKSLQGCPRCKPTPELRGPLPAAAWDFPRTVLLLFPRDSDLPFSVRHALLERSLCKYKEEVTRRETEVEDQGLGSVTVMPGLPLAAERRARAVPAEETETGRMGQ